ncbi:unnamed protein product [Darwinula stevensoni]|uniref:Histone deacetylase domain-containing protein n=1 Tax=Darwinula stevensoni TaxID=69355 RepID=A0A7R9FQ06_9CRUS|nr:unnamed protein product [Darwinula stevensoni]CAG0898390.1 unnamed protein product [Darwinula stevensoni]
MASSRLYTKVDEKCWSIIYSPQYDMKICGLEKIHPADSCKYQHIFEHLKKAGMLTDKNHAVPLEANEEELLLAHGKSYLNSLKHLKKAGMLTDENHAVPLEANEEELLLVWSYNVMAILEAPFILLIPNYFIQRFVLSKFRYHVGGTVLAGKLAMERGWAINIGGGLHHCSGNSGGGLCPYADITLCVYMVQKNFSQVKKVMIIDLDAHQGNGHERDFMDDKSIYIFDMFNSSIYPGDREAMKGITLPEKLSSGTDDSTFLNLLERNLEKAFKEFSPDFILYNAGTDIMAGDPTGLMEISDKGVIKRDELVFREAYSRRIPIVMVTSGGFQRRAAAVIGDSILNLRDKELITIEPWPEFTHSKDGNES